MVSIAQCKFKIDSDSIAWLKQKGVELPENASSFDYVLAPKFTEYTELFTFKDKLDLRIKQQKNHVNKKTHEKTTQIREYDYTKRFYSEGKISEVRQTTINPDGTEQKENWRFYYPKDKSAIRFSHKKENSEINNYLQADGYIIDKNGLKIRPISTAEYCDKKKDVKYFIDSPWTTEQSVTTKEPCATDSIQECTVVGIYGDKGLSLNHLNPNNPVNQDFDKIEDVLSAQLEQQGKNAKAFVIGACEQDWESRRQFENLIDFLAVRHVPYSKYKTGDKVLYFDFKDATKVNSANSKLYKYGKATPFEWQSGQHIIYDNGEIQLANPIIDAELKKGNTDPESLIKKSFSRIYR